MGKIFISSDTHFGHDRDFIWHPRGFNSVHEMNEEIIRRWNEVVSWEDEVYLLGDCMLGDNEKGIRNLNRLNGKIWILTGNHDTATRIQMYVNIRPTILHLGYVTTLNYEGYHFYLSHYPTLIGNYDDKGLKKGYINLCGHYHTNDPFADWDKGKIFHTELDTNNCYPWLLDDIITKIENKVK